jgi:5-methylcytosine-specific restriction endonuclease McrA
MAVFVLDKHKKPLMPTSEKRARLLLSRGRAVVVSLYPFAIRLKDRVGGDLQELAAKIDPGSKETGVAVVRVSDVVDIDSGEIKTKLTVLNLFQLNHRGGLISKNLESRKAMRRRRRFSLRYRKCRPKLFKTEGWLAPSLRHRVESTLLFIKRLQKLAPITLLSQELVKFDMQKMENPEISGVEYQQGTLLNFEVKEYLLEKWGRKCAYCGQGDRPLETEHVHCRAKGGTNRISNLTIACVPCNQAKGTLSIDVFLADRPELLKSIKLQLKTPLKHAAAVNSTRNELARQLASIGLPVELASGGKTKFNRKQHLIPKAHALDAACVGSFDLIENWNKPTLEIKCMGRGQYKRTLLTEYGFPRAYLMRTKTVNGFQTGDMVKAVVTKGKKIGTYIGRVAVRANGYFNINDKSGLVQGIKHQDCTLIARNDGYGYKLQPKIA